MYNNLIQTKVRLRRFKRSFQFLKYATCCGFLFRSGSDKSNVMQIFKIRMKTMQYNIYLFIYYFLKYQTRFMQ